MHDSTEQAVQIAYQTGDLEALIDAMTAEQQSRLQQAIVRQALFYLLQKLPPEADDHGEREFVALAQDWLADPTPEKADRAASIAALEMVDGEIRYFELSDHWLEPLWAMIFPAFDAARCALKVAQHDLQTAAASQVETAWASLQNQALPLLSPSVAANESDAAWD